MSEQPENRGLSIFDKAETGGFHVRSRGYDREQVERYVRKLEDKLNAAVARSVDRGELLAKAETRIGELSSEVSSLRTRLDEAEARLRNAEQPSFAGLGDHVAGLLKSAEQQATTLVTTATADAERMRSDAAADADASRRNAEDYSEQIRTAADDYAEATRRDADAYAEATRAEATGEAARMRQEAKEDATAARVAAVDESKALLAEVQQAVSELRTAAEQDIAELRAAAERDADEQRGAAATVLHDARRRADHEIGAVAETLATIKERLSLNGVDAGPNGAAPDEHPDDAAELSDETQVIPTAAEAT